MALLVKLAAAEVSFAQAVLFRSVVGLPIIAIAARRRGVSLLGRRRGLLLARGVAGTSALLLFFYAVTEIAIGEAVLLNQTAPVFVLPLAALFLGERVTARHAAWVAVAMAGVFLVVRPEMGKVSAPSLLALASAFLAAVAYVLVRELTETESALTIVFWFTLVATVVSAPIAASDFVFPSAPILAALLGAGVLATISQLLMTRAYAHGQAARLAVIGSTGAVLGAVWDLVFWGHVPDALTAAGGALVIAACAAIQMLRGAPTPPRHA